ncbi:hypothetical protein [Acinetobacter gyllenbergii]|uniref:Uncharacterized protein n=1 Tax=Acinetobacter gyllenbergii CIP 110306 = MTCC 11365 TaxID=1217657 RepID=A0A829HG84_9GAMM|nr:hypothetical protein [Acinetobacter gyllenbergii]EPF77471.1 hypothetical protein F957_02643 [Acinetobacter gyllenbergii CIP 110306 = MTCC 11365]
MRQFKSLHLAMLLFSSSCLNFAYATTSTLKSMTDSELSEAAGQALLSMSYISPTDLANKEAQRIGGDNSIGFYKLGLEAEMELNVNIKSLQLGCGGVNGAGGCDIDIDYISLSGLGNSATSNTDSAADRAARVGSSAVLSNPFIEFAIKNPDKASTRQVVGLNSSAEKALGLVTFGLENGPEKSGINSLSGYMEIAATTGVANVNGFGNSQVAGEADRGTLNQSDGYNSITGKICSTPLLCIPTIDFETTSYTLNLRDKATGSNILKGDLAIGQQAITGKRINTANLAATAKVRDIDLSGNIVARAIGLNLDKQVTGTIQNLLVDAAISENLGYFHKADLNGTAASLSLQSQNIQWTNNKSVSQNGWWLEFSNPMDIGFIEPVFNVDIPKATLNEALGQVSQYLNDHPIDCGALGALNCLLGDTVPVGTVNLINATRPQMGLTDLQLATQNFTPNCYGTLKFC